MGVLLRHLRSPSVPTSVVVRCKGVLVMVMKLMWRLFGWTQTASCLWAVVSMNVSFYGYCVTVSCRLSLVDGRARNPDENPSYWFANSFFAFCEDFHSAATHIHMVTGAGWMHNPDLAGLIRPPSKRGGTQLAGLIGEAV